MVDLELLSEHAQGDIGKLLGQFALLLIFVSLWFSLPALLGFGGGRTPPMAQLRCGWWTVRGAELGFHVPGPARRSGAGASPRTRAVARRRGRSFDGRMQIEVVDDLVRQTGSRVEPAVYPHLLTDGGRSPLSWNGAEFVPLAGISCVTTVLCNEGGQYAIYASDRHGFRNPDQVWDFPHTDIAFVGDSSVRRRYPATGNLGVGEAGRCCPRESPRLSPEGYALVGQEILGRLPEPHK
ncbi:MAG: hypothetical protein HY013_22075 [Candidatus Solibacter usitatus]|nr:hypothetical protein [Candidatus Solibacter usitatus]